jgi:hypothetical protein
MIRGGALGKLIWHMARDCLSVLPMQVVLIPKHLVLMGTANPILNYLPDRIACQQLMFTVLYVLLCRLWKPRSDISDINRFYLLIPF